MKDLDSLPVLEKLVTTGVHTLKIEGRKKDAQYVATVVARYRRALDTIFGRSTLRDSAPPEARSFLQPTAQDENALSFSFQRAPTSLFLTDRSNSVIDTTATTHAGLLVGNIQRLSSTTLVLRTAVPLEKYDGLRFGAQEFSLRSMKIKGRPVTQAPQGAEVEIELPLEKASLPTAGMPVYKTRCSRLKATVDGISHPPAGARVQPRDTIDLSIHLQQQGESVLFTAEAYAAGACFLTYQQTLSLEWAKKESRLEEDIRQTFRLFGDAAFAVNTLNIEANPAFFIPKSLLKELKNIVGSLLRQSYQRLWERTANELMTSVDREFASAANSHEKSSFINRTNDEKSTGAPTPRYALKVDSVENLAALSQALTQTNFSGNELIFEAHPVANQDEIFSALHSFSAQHPAISLRLALPAVLRAEDAAQLRPFFAAALAQGFLNFEVGNVGGRAFLQELGWSPKGAGSLVADHTLYVMNHEAALFLREQGFCRYTIGLEDDLENVARLLKNEGDSLPAQAILYSVPTLFVAEGCTLAGLRGSCPGSPACSRPPLQCEGESPKEQLSITHRECRSFVHPTQPFAATHLRSQFEKQGVSYFKLEFVLRRFSAAEIATVLEKTREESPLPCSFSGNLGGSLR